MSTDAFAPGRGLPRHPASRREFLARSSAGFGLAALSGMLGPEAAMAISARSGR